MELLGFPSPNQLLRVVARGVHQELLNLRGDGLDGLAGVCLVRN